MPRAKPFGRGDIELRSKALQVDPNLIDKLVQQAGIVNPDKRKEFTLQLDSIIRKYRAEIIANRQERPAQLVAALRPGLKPAKRLLDWLLSLPTSLRADLNTGGVEGLLVDLKILTKALISKTNRQIRYWDTHVHANRPAGERGATLALRQSLADLIKRYSGGASATANKEERSRERKIRSWVAFVSREIGARYPNEKKEIPEHESTRNSGFRNSGFRNSGYRNSRAVIDRSSLALTKLKRMSTES